MTTKKDASRRPDLPRQFAESILLLVATVAVLWFGSEIVRAQNPPNTTPPRSRGAAPTPTPTPTPTPSPSAEPTPFVPEGGVYKYGLTPAVGGSANTAQDKARRAGMNDIIIVKVRHLQKLLDEANCKTSDSKDKPDCTKQNIVLYLEGRAMKGLVPESGAPIPEEETLRFHLQRASDSDEEWADLLGAPPLFSSRESREGSLFIRPVKVSVGLENKHAIPSKVERFSFIRVHEWLFWFALIGLIALLIAVVVLARKTSLLRDDGPAIGENRKGEETDELSYSLGRCQMAFWFFLVITSFIFIFVITWQFNTVTEQALALMGISAATALGAVIVSANKEDQSDANLQDAASRYPALKTEREDLENRTRELSSKVQNRTATDAERKELDEKRARLRRLKKEIRDLSTVSQGFIDDLLTDIHGYSFHRFQIFVWTIVLGFIFLHGVYNRLAMPAFSATLLALLGISGATYIGFKIPEKQEPAAPPAAP